MNEVIIATRGLSKEYVLGSETVRALRGVDLEIHRNEYVAIMGPSGSGKSTLMNLIGCLDTPSGGEYILNGQAATPHFGENPYGGRYNNTIAFMAEIIARRVNVRGMIASDHVAGRVKIFDNQMKAWIDEGKVRPIEDIVAGLEQAPEAFQGVFEGRNRGTRLVQVAG